MIPRTKASNARLLDVDCQHASAVSGIIWWLNLITEIQKQLRCKDVKGKHLAISLKRDQDEGHCSQQRNISLRSGVNKTMGHDIASYLTDKENGETWSEAYAGLSGPGSWILGLGFSLISHVQQVYIVSWRRPWCITDKDRQVHREAGPSL